MPSFASSRSIHAYDRTIHMISSSLTLVSISEEAEYSPDSPTIVRNNPNLRRDSFGNQSCRTGLDAVANAHSHDNCASLAKDARFERSQGYHRHAPSSHDMTAWGFFIDE